MMVLRSVETTKVERSCSLFVFITLIINTAQKCDFISLELNIYEELTGTDTSRLAPPTCHRRAERIKKIYLKVSAFT